MTTHDSIVLQNHNIHKMANGDYTNMASVDCSEDKNGHANGIDEMNCYDNTDGVASWMQYGWLSFRSSSLQFLNKPFWFLACLCALVVAQGMIITGVSSVILTSIEKRYGFTSTQAGALSSSYDTAYGVCCILVSYFGHLRKPKFLGVGAIILAIGCFFATVPHYLIGPYEAGVTQDTDLCHFNNGTSAFTSPKCRNSSWYYLFIFCLAYLMMGVGATPIYTLGPSHIDESTKRGQNGVYLGIMYTFAALGPALGYGLGLPLLSTYVDIKQPARSSLTPKDKNWVGAWWIGYLVGTSLLFLASIPMLGFPQEFKKTAKLRASKRELQDTVEEDPQLHSDWKSLWPATKSLLMNKTFMFITLSTTAESLATGGFSTFLPKFIENQFHVTSSNASLYAGLVVIPGVGGGIFLGGYLIKKYNWTCQQTIKACAIIAFCAVLCTLAVLVGCKGRNVVGATVPYQNRVALNLYDPCRGNCSCSEMYYKPICTKDDMKTYFDACHAGCGQANMKGNKYYNCSCFPPGITVAESGACIPECNLLLVFLACFLLTMFVTFMNNVPILHATFRVVPESQGSYAMGFQQVFVRFLGFIPGPLLFGKLIDKSCILWQQDQCGTGTQNCLDYKNDTFRYYLLAAGGFVKFLSFVFLALAYKFYEPPRKEPAAVKTDLVMTVYPPESPAE